MCKIEVKLYGLLRKYRPQDVSGAPHHPFPLTIPTNTTVSALAAQLHIPDGLVNAAAINGEAVDLSTHITPDTTVSLFPPSAGGMAVIVAHNPKIKLKR